MPLLEATLLCLVVGVTDGDTLKARCDGKQINVRLAEIDAPEKAQPFGQRSKQSLSQLCYGKRAEIQTVTTDRYARTVARVICAGTDANAEQVRRGMAWVYEKYATDLRLYSLQAGARASGHGLWTDDDPTPPWIWRASRR